jgi:hypothetical protein
MELSGQGPRNDLGCTEAMAALGRRRIYRPTLPHPGSDSSVTTGMKVAIVRPCVGRGGTYGLTHEQLARPPRSSMPRSYLPYAIHRVHGTNPFDKFGSCCHAGIHALPRGKRRPQSYTYSPYLPQLQYNRVLKAFFGGNFWDSRSTGNKLSSPNAEQAQHPPVDSVHNLIQI